MSAVEAQAEAKVFSDRGLMEAIYILLRRNDLGQQNVAAIGTLPLVETNRRFEVEVSGALAELDLMAGSTTQAKERYAANARETLRAALYLKREATKEAHHRSGLTVKMPSEAGE